MTVERIKFVHGHLFVGIGMGAKGFQQASARLGNRELEYICAGGIDVDPGAIKAFEQIIGVPGTVQDLFSREQYAAFHGRQPPSDWREATPEDILRAMRWMDIDCAFLSAPCKGFSGLTSESRSKSDKYQALNQLAVRGLLLLLEAYKGRPIPFILFENVPRIQSRGRALIDQIIQLLQAYGYATAETTHDCGELGGLAQSRKRFLLVARHIEKVPPFLYEPVKKPLISVGRLLEKFPLPGDTSVVGPMHRIPALQWKTWVRLAFVEAGSDWRSLQKLAVENGFLRDFAIMPEAAYHAGAYGMQPWDEPAGTVTGNGRPASGTFSIADPRYDTDWKSSQLGVNGWNASSGVVTGQRSPAQGTFSIADPRVDGHHKSVQLGVRAWDQTIGVVKGDMSAGCGPYTVADPRIDGVRHNNVFRIVRWGDVSPSVTGGGHPTAGGLNVADPRYAWQNAHESKMRVSEWGQPSRAVTGSDRVGSGALSVSDPRAAHAWEGGGKYRVNRFDEAAGTVIAESGTGNGAFAVADPRPPSCPPEKHEPGHHYQSAGNYGVVPWDESSGAVSANMCHDNAYSSVADPRLPAASERIVCVIRALDNTWHRPFTTLELAALQGMVDPDELFTLPGKSDSQHREWIGNGVPPPAARAVASVMGHTKLLAMAGETFMLGSTPIWVRPTAIALSLSRRFVE